MPILNEMETRDNTYVLAKPKFSPDVMRHTRANEAYQFYNPVDKTLSDVVTPEHIMTYEQANSHTLPEGFQVEQYSELEISVTPMMTDEDGACIAEYEDEVEFYDLLVKIRYPLTLTEHELLVEEEELDLESAEKLYEEMMSKYPNAYAEWLETTPVYKR